jgi:hypothetical protein
MTKKLTRMTTITRPWNIRKVDNILNAAYSRFYSPSIYLANDEVIVLVKGKIAFMHINTSEETLTLMVTHITLMFYLGKDRKHARIDMTVTHTTVEQPTRVVERRGHKLHI